MKTILRNFHRRQAGVAVALAAAALAVLYLGVGSANWDLYRLKTAAQEQDSTSFNQRVDYPRLRESLKSQMMGMLGESSQDSWSSGAASAMGRAFVERMIDTLVRPEMVIRMMSGASEPGTAGFPARGKDPDSHLGTELVWKSEWVGLHRMVVQVRSTQDAEKASFSLVLERHGLASWQVVELRLPRPEEAAL